LPTLYHNSYTPNPKVYDARFEVQAGAWGLQRCDLIGQVQPQAEGVRANPHQGQGVTHDEGTAVVKEINGTRRLILTTAVQLIAEQHPTRLDNLLWNVAPFAIGRIGKIAKLSKLAILKVIKTLRPLRWFQPADITGGKNSIPKLGPVSPFTSLVLDDDQALNATAA
jgi:hypothetical protein